MLKEPELGLHEGLKGIFPFEALHKHQELALRSVVPGQHTLIATGTGSGKTESFLLPILNHCFKLRDAGKTNGVTAIIVYPMNALVNDQLERLRWMLAGTHITFGRYTGETPDRAGAQLEQLARAHSLKGNSEEARQYYKTIIDKYPGSRQFLMAEVNYGDLLVKDKQYDEAQEWFQRLINLYPNSRLAQEASRRLQAIAQLKMQVQLTTPSLSTKNGPSTPASP